MAGADGQYGQGSLEVVRMPEVDVVVDTVPGAWFEGQVVDGAGVPVTGRPVRALHADWPEEVSNALGLGATDESGMFKLFAGLAMEGTVEVRGGVVTDRSDRVEVGRPARIVCQR
jgi:hypothetical protein